MEEERHFRSWQDGNMTYEEIFKEVSLPYPKKSLVFNKSYERKTCGT